MAWVACAGAVFAAPPIVPPQLDPGAIDAQKQQMERYNREQLRREQDDGPVITAPERKETPATGAEAGPRFVLARLTFSPSKFLQPAELEAIVQPFIGREVGMADLAGIVGQVNELYNRRKLVTALAVLPPQKIVAGEVHVDLVEGKLGTAEVGSTYTDGSYLLSHLSLQHGDVVDVPQVERDLIWFNRTHDIQLKSSIKPGKAPGSTDFEIQAIEPKRIAARVFADNQNSPNLGRDQVGMDVRVNGLLGRGDFLSMLVSTSQGATNGYVGVGIPFNTKGGQVTASYSENNIGIIDGPYKALDIKGVSHRGTLGVSQPFYVDREWLLSSALTYAKSDSTNVASGVQLSRFDVDTFGVSLSVDRQGPGYQWTLQQTLESGRAIDQLRNRTEYLVYSATASGILSLAENFYGIARAGGQHTGAATLPPSALFQVGGPATVRGYDTGFVTGHDGYYASVELHRSLAPGWEPFVFVDHGEAYSPNAPRTRIAGIGGGLSWTKDKLVAKLVYGKPLGIIRPNQPNGRIDVRVEMSF